MNQPQQPSSPEFDEKGRKILEEALAASNRNAAAIDIQKLLSRRIRNLSTVAAWGSRMEGNKEDQSEAQPACAKEFQKLKASVIKELNR